MKGDSAWTSILVLLAIIVFLLFSTVRKSSTISELMKSNKKHLQEIEKRDSLLTISDAKLDSISSKYDKVILSIDSMKINYNLITPKYAKTYLNPDSVNWYKLDSLTTILLYRESRLRDEDLHVPGL